MLYRSCKFKYPAGTEEKESDASGHRCTLQDGSGVGDYLERAYIGKVGSPGECMEGCAHLRRIDVAVNGITMNKQRCWCERNMKSIGEYKTCIINK